MSVTSSLQRFYVTVSQPLLSIDPFGIDMFGCDNYGARARTSHCVSQSHTLFLSTCRDFWIITISPLFSSVIAAKKIPRVIIRSAASLVHRRIIFCFRSLQSGATNTVLYSHCPNDLIPSVSSPRLEQEITIMNQVKSCSTATAALQ